jgi:hypothetical protein
MLLVLAPMAFSRFYSTPFSERARSFIDVWRRNMLDLSKSVLDQGKSRDDYLEFVKLCIVFLDSNSDEKVTFKRPGALHKARWMAMAKVIYSIKICLLEQQIPLLPV